MAPRISRSLNFFFSLELVAVSALEDTASSRWSCELGNPASETECSGNVGDVDVGVGDNWRSAITDVSRAEGGGDRSGEFDKLIICSDNRLKGTVHWTARAQLRNRCWLLGRVPLRPRIQNRRLSTHGVGPLQVDFMAQPGAEQFSSGLGLDCNVTPDTLHEP